MSQTVENYLRLKKFFKFYHVYGAWARINDSVMDKQTGMTICPYHRVYWLNNLDWIDHIFVYCMNTALYMYIETLIHVCLLKLEH